MQNARRGSAALPLPILQLLLLLQQLPQLRDVTADLFELACRSTRSSHRC